MDSFDVVIVGGGPAGSTCARALRRAGLEVAIVDKAEFPRDKVCAGWITPQVVAELELDLDDYRRSRVLQPIGAFLTGLVGQGSDASSARMEATQPVRYDDVVSYGIRRCEFDHYLLERSGARVFSGEAWKSMERHDGRWVVNGHLSAPLVIGAGGHFCPVARFLGAHLGKDERAIYAQEIEFEMSDEQAARCSVLADRPELYFCDDLKGYGWAFRKGNFVNVGLGREGNHRLNEQVQAFCEALVAAGRLSADTPRRFKGHAYLLYAHAERPLVQDGVLLIGDAAGLAYTQSGEGIRPAIESAMLAAQVVVESARDYRRERLAAYEALLRARFGPVGQKPALGGVIPPGLRLKIAHALMRTRWFTKRVLLDRWFLHSAVPALSDGN
jgi:geranylgeranyl reductase family protein